MFSKKMKTNEVDYKLSCRCCLKSDAEFYKLDAVTVARNIVSDDLNSLGSEDNVERITLLRCLHFCIRTENVPELPQYICVGCSKSLQIAFYFIQNSLRAHEILCHKLCSPKIPQSTRVNGQLKRSIETSKATTQNRKQEVHGQHKICGTNDDDPTEKAKLQKTVRHECKICGAIIYNRLELKQHIRLHSDVISYSCKICNYVTVKERQLGEHYSTIHGLTDVQVKPLEKAVKFNKTTTRPKLPQVPAINKQINTMNAAMRTHGAATASAQEDTVETVCTLEDMELLIPTVLRPEDYTQPRIDDDQLRDIEEHLVANIQTTSTAAQLASTVDLNEALATLDLPQYINMDNTAIDVGTNQPASNMTIGTEFLVLPDGSLQQVNDGGVVIEYINAANDNSQSNNIKTSTNSGPTNIAMQNLLATPVDSSPMDIDVNEMIVEDVLPHINTKSVHGPGQRFSVPMKYKCGLCPKTFATIARLKSHQLTHSNLPKFYCDQCEFYSLRSSDLMQHYKTHHKIDTSSAQLDVKSLATPADENKVFSCDMCLFETQSRGQLRAHYTKKHMVEPTEIQLRPSWCTEGSGSAAPGSASHDELNSNQKQQSGFPLGIKYPCAVSSMEVSSASASATTTVDDINVSDGMSFLFDTSTNNLSANVNVNPIIIVSSAETATVSTDLPVDSNRKSFAIYPENSTNLATNVETMQPLTTPPNASVFGDMQEFIDNTDVAAICTIPAEGMPVVDGDDIVIDNNNISLDFDAENLFDDFEEEAENDDENENTDSATDQNLLLTSDDDVDDFDDEQSKNLQKPYCIFCNKKFTSQYKFENHMFSHRGLAPYRCELCTNIYNMKHLLIRHYKTVHKRMPTRDMVQAKGDKEPSPSNIEKLHIDMDKSPGFMCSKCPYECKWESEMRKHVGSHHGINDTVSRHAFEVFIIRKLPFECPRCIRTFAAKRHLTRHLQRSHLVDTIIELQSSQTATSTTSTTTTITPTTALPNTNESVINTIQHSTTTTGAMIAVSDVAVGALGCDDNGREKDDQHTKTDIKSGQTDLSINLQINTNSHDNDLTTSPTQAIKSSMLFPTPTPIDAFDFDYDFMGDGHANTATTVHDNSDNYASTSSQTQIRVLNSSDKILTAALAGLETSPVKDLRNCLPRTPIYVCKKCNHTFDELTKFNQHQTDQHSNTESTQARRKFEFECGICNSTYRTITLLRYHMKRHVKRNYKCEQCPKMFVLKLELDKHRAIHCNELSYKCNMSNCNKAFNYKHHLKRHQNATHLRKRYKCHIPNCGRELTTNSQLLQHIRGHKGLHAYKCPECTRTYTRRKPLRLHALRVHQLHMTEDDLAEVYRKSMGYTNPHDMKIITPSGELLRRSVVEAAAKHEQRSELSETVVNIK